MTNNILEIVGALGGKPSGENSWLCHCPAHQDNTPSLSVSLSDGKILCYCHAGCSQESVIDKLKNMGLWDEKKTEIKAKTKTKTKKKGKLIKSYDYIDQDGQVLYQVCRFEPKNFMQRKPDGRGGWTWSLKGISRILYNLPAVLASDKVFICEGEKDADAISALGSVGTTNAGGASNWIPEYSTCLSDKECIILPDNDGPGMKHAQKIAKSLSGVAKSVKIIELPDLPQKGDVSDWISSGNTMDSILALADKTKEFDVNVEPEPLTDNKNIDTAKQLCLTYFIRGYDSIEVVTLLKTWNTKNSFQLSDVEIKNIVKSEFRKDQKKKFSGIAEAINKIIVLKYPDGTTKYKLFMSNNRTITINVDELLSSRRTCAKIVEATMEVFNPQKQDKWLDLVRIWLDAAVEEKVAVEETDLGVIKEIIGGWIDQWNKHKESEHINYTAMLANSCVVTDSKVYFILAHLEEDLRLRSVKLSRTVLCEQLRLVGARTTKPVKRFNKIKTRTWEISENNNMD
jgi:5S rRNA maturation endonuclease (ribonuclease M5)